MVLGVPILKHFRVSDLAISVDQTRREFDQDLHKKLSKAQKKR